MDIATESDMNMLRSVFEKVSNTITQASELAKAVTGLQAQVTDLQSQVRGFHYDIEQARQKNAELDSLLNDVRTQRDTAQADVISIRAKLAETERERDGSIHHAQDMERDATSYRETINRLTKERDDAIMESLQANDKLSAANAKLDDIQALAKTMFPHLGEPAKPVELTPLPVPPVQAINEPTDTRTWWEKERDAKPASQTW